MAEQTAVARNKKVTDTAGKSASNTRGKNPVPLMRIESAISDIDDMTNLPDQTQF